MCQILKAITVALLVAIVGTEPASAQERVVEENVALAPGARLSLDADRGTVRLTSWDEPTVRIRARIVAPTGVDSGYAQRAVDDTRIEVESGPGFVDIRTNYEDVPDRRWWFGSSRALPSVHYEITAPRQLDLDLNIDRSDTTIDDFAGQVRLDLDRSSLEAVNLDGDIRLDIDRADNVTLTTIRGSLDVDIDRSALAVRDVAGRIQIDGDRSGTITLDRVQGSFVFDVDRSSLVLTGVTIQSDSQIRVNRGDVDVGLASPQGLVLDVDVSRRATIFNDVPGSRSKASDRRYRETLSGGGPEFRIQADRSRIELHEE